MCKESQCRVAETCVLLRDTASSLAGKMSLDLFPLVVISTTTITEIHHFLTGEWRTVGVCFSSGVDRKLFILSLFGKTSAQRSLAPAWGGAGGEETVTRFEPQLGRLPDLRQATSLVCSSQKWGELLSKERGRQAARRSLAGQRQWPAYQ